MVIPATSNKKRLAIFFFAAVIVFLGLAVRIGYLMFVEGEDLQNKAESQWTRNLTVSPQRGSITDRNGNVLAQSASAKTVVLRPSEVKDAGEVANLLAPILDMDSDTIYDKASDKTKSEIWLKRQISDEQAEKIEKLALDGVHFTVDVKRYYPNNDFLAQTLGFTTVDGEGIEGIEKYYNKYLAGQSGKIVAQTDNKGRVLEDSEQVYVEAKDGYNVELTIDEVIQSFLEQACEDALEANDAQAVWGIVMDPNTAEIYAICNKPDYDLNDVPRNDADALLELSRNKAIVDTYEPGSTFKIITGASALDSGAATMKSEYNCIGYKMVDGEKIKCWRSYNPHGHEDIYEAFQNSCNPVFMEMALGMGTQKFYDYIYNFGFGQKTGIDFTADGTGIVRNIKYVKNVDLARIGFGQSIAVTPLQLVTAVSSVINGGDLYTPSLVKAIVDNDGNIVEQYEPEKVRKVISDETSANMRKLLQGVVDKGSGKAAQIDGYTVGGKTGTAQKFKDGKLLEGKTIGSFIAFAPVENPQFVVYIAVDEPNVGVDFGSVVAAPFVKEVLEDTLKYAGVAPDKEVTESTEQVKVPDVTGMTLKKAQEALGKVGLTADADGTGKVKSQTPADSETVNKGSKVILSMSEKAGEEEPEEGLSTVPDLSGMTIVKAMQALKEEGLKISVSGSGVVKSQEPEAGTLVEPGTTVKTVCEKAESGDGDTD